NHKVLHSEDSHAEDDGVEFWRSDQLIRCCGCDELSYRRATQCSEDFDPETGDLVVTEELYPSRTEDREPIKDYDEFPLRTRRIYLETLKALNSNALILTAIGLRAVIESICVEQKVTAPNLAKGIDELATSGLLSQKQADFLHAHRFMGNAAAHEMVAPKPADLIAALDIAETLLKTIYVLPDVADRLKPKNA
ncbi:MAG TPA: DUF4145 domain-containing protein, partial [Candidatus Binatia bacterium]|nr:DUF4145 domain-containing protein [Candidatus Binatia bacterium]